jgi:hypothetical protein
LVAVLVCIYLNFARWNVHWIAEPIAGVTGLSVFDSGDWTCDRRDFREHEDNFLKSSLNLFPFKYNISSKSIKMSRNRVSPKWK